MQTKTLTGIDADITLSEANLGWDLAGYTAHSVVVYGLAGETWSASIRFDGCAVYLFTEDSELEGTMTVYVGAERTPIDRIKIEFSAPPTAASIFVRSISRTSEISV